MMKTREDEIDEYLDDLREIWLKSPDLRLGQLVANLAHGDRTLSHEVWMRRVFTIADEDLLRSGAWWQGD